VPIAVDFDTARPTVAQLQAADVVAVLRYITGPDGKAIDADELALYRSAGIVVGFVFGIGAQDAAGGFPEGQTAAQAALTALSALGLTEQPVYFAVDESITPSLAVPYFRGICSIIPPALVGAYGEGALLTLLKADGLASFFWQSESTSFPGNAATLPISDLRQFFNQSPIIGTDYDEILSADFGQFPRPGGDVQLPTLGGITGSAEPYWTKSVQSLLASKFNQAVPLTGVYDEATTAGIRAVQGFFGIPITGVTDSETWSILLGF
jgi:hypothetical protein